MASTSLTFMFVWVPLPVCHSESGSSSGHLPASTSSAACSMASAMRGSTAAHSTLARAAAFFTSTSASSSSGGIFSVPMRKWIRLRAVCAP